MAGSCEQSNELQVFLKSAELLDLMMVLLTSRKGLCFVELVTRIIPACDNPQLKASNILDNYRKYVLNCNNSDAPYVIFYFY